MEVLKAMKVHNVEMMAVYPTRTVPEDGLPEFMLIKLNVGKSSFNNWMI